MGRRGVSSSGLAHVAGTNDGAGPVAHPKVVAIVHAVADGPVADALLTLLQLLQEPEVPWHCATAGGPVLSSMSSGTTSRPDVHTSAEASSHDRLGGCHPGQHEQAIPGAAHLRNCHRRLPSSRPCALPATPRCGCPTSAHAKGTATRRKQASCRLRSFARGLYSLDAGQQSKQARESSSSNLHDDLMLCSTVIRTLCIDSLSH